MAGKRNELMIAEDRAKVCKLLAMGYTSKTEIASIINSGREQQFHISATQIHNDIEYMKNKYLETGIEDFKIYRNKVLDEINLLQRTYWEGYELSRRNKISIESEQVLEEEEYDDTMKEGLQLTSGEKIFQRVARTREEQRLEGNPAYLQGVGACIDRKAKIYGVDGTNKIALTDVTGTRDAVDIAQLMKDKMDALASKHNEFEKPEPLQLETSIEEVYDN